MMSDKNRRIHCFVDVEIGGNSAGRIVLELFSDVCPKTCSNFVKLCNGEKIDDELVGYKGKPFSAVDSAVKVECTCSSEAVCEELKNRTYPDEISVLKHFKELLLSTANRGSEANGLQWIITTASTPELNSTHLVFGRVVSGQGVVEQIHAATKDDHDQRTARARIGNCGELKPRSLDQRKPPAIYRTSADFYNSRESSDEVHEDSWTKTLTLASAVKRNNKLSRVVSSTSGDRKIKGRGTVRYKGSSSRSRSESDDTPPHWRTELEKVKPLGKDVKEVPEDRWIKGDKLVFEESLSRRSDRRYSRTESDDDDYDTERCRRRSGRYSRRYEDDSDRESSSHRSRKKSERYSRRYDSDEEDSRSYRKMSEKRYLRQGESESDDDKRSKKRSRNRSRSVVYDSSDNSTSRKSKKKSSTAYSRSDFESDEEMPRSQKKLKHSRSSEYETEDDSPKRSSKKSERRHTKRGLLKSNEDSPRGSSRISRRNSRRVEYEVKYDSSDQCDNRSESYDSRTEGSENDYSEKKQRSRYYEYSARSPFKKKESSIRKPVPKKKKKKHSKNSRDLSREPFSETESEHSRTSTLDSCDLKPGKSKPFQLKLSQSKSTGRQESCNLKRNARKDDFESENTKDFDKIRSKNSSLEHFGEAVKGSKKRDVFPEGVVSDCSHKTEVKSSDEELKTGRKSRKEDRPYRTESCVPEKLKLQTVGDKAKQKLEESGNKLNSRTFIEKNAMNQVVIKKFTSKADRVEIVIPSSEEDEENAIVQPSLKKKLKPSSSNFNWEVAHAASSMRKKGNMSASKEGIPDIEKRCRMDINVSGGNMEEFQLNSGSHKTSGSNSGSSIRSQSTDRSGEMPGNKSCFDSRPAKIMQSGKKSKSFLEVPKSGLSAAGRRRKRSRSLSSDGEENQSLSTVEKKKIHSDKFSVKTHAMGSNYSLELSKQYCQIKKLQVKSKLKELDPYSYAQSSVQRSVSSSSRSDDRDLADQPEFVSRKQSKSHSEKIRSSSRYLSSSPERQVHQGNLRSKSRSCSKSSSQSHMSVAKSGKHGRWSQSPESQRKRMRSYSNSSRSCSSRSRNYKSLRSGRRHVTMSSSSGNSRSRSSSRSWSRSRSNTESRSRRRQRSARSSRLAEQEEFPALAKAAASVAPVALRVGNSSSAAVENLSESPPPSRWKPGQKPWKPKNNLPASNRLAGYESLNSSALSALSAQRSKEDYFQKSQSQRSSEVGRSSLTDGQSRGSRERSKGLKVRGHRRHSSISEGSSRNSLSDRSVSKSRSYTRTDSNWSKSGSDRSKSKSDRNKSRSDRSKSRSDWSMYESKTKNSKTIDRRSDSRSGDSMSRTGSQKSHTGSSRSRSASSKNSRSKSASCRSSMSASGSSRSDSRSSRNKRSKRNEREKHEILKKSSALNAQSSQEQSKASHKISISSRDSGAYNKLSAVKLDTAKSVRKEKVKKQKKGSQKVQWQPPVEPEYILVDTEDEDSKLDDPSKVSIRKNRKWSKKDGDAIEAEFDKTEISVEQRAQKERASEEEHSSENVAVEQTLAEVQKERKGQPKDEELAETCEVTVASDMRLDLPDPLEKQSLKVEMDISEVNSKNQSVIVEAENQVADVKEENVFADVEAENEVADVKAENEVTDVKAENEVADVKAENEVADVKAENEVADMKAENEVADVKAENEVADVKEGNEIADVSAKNKIIEVNANNQTVSTNLQNKTADVIGENQVTDVKTENQVILDVKTENQMISDINIEGLNDESLLLHSERKDNTSRKSHDIRNICNIMGEASTSLSNILETKNKTSDAVNAEDLTPLKAPESCPSIFSTADEIKEFSESDSKLEMASASVVESAPKSQITFLQHQSRSGPSKLPKLNLQDNRLLGKQLNFMWKSRLRLPVSGSAGVVHLNSPESPRVPVLSLTISPDKSGHPGNVMKKSPVLVEDSPAERDKEQPGFPKQLTRKSSEKVRQSWVVPSESLQIPSAKRSVSSGDSSSRSSSQSSRASISSNSSADLERSPSARSKSGRSYSNSLTQSPRCDSEGSDQWSRASDSRSPSFVSERRRSTTRTRSKNRTRRDTRSRTRSRSRRRTRSRTRRRTRSRTRSILRRIHQRSRSCRSRKRRSYSKRSSRSQTRRSFRSRSGRSRSRSNSRTPGSRLGRSRTRSRSRRSRTISRRRSYSRQMSGSSEYDSWSRSASRSRSYGRRSRSSSQDSYRKRRSTRSSHSRSYSSD